MAWRYKDFGSLSDEELYAVIYAVRHDFDQHGYPHPYEEALASAKAKLENEYRRRPK